MKTFGFLFLIVALLSTARYSAKAQELKKVGNAAIFNDLDLRKYVFKDANDHEVNLGQFKGKYVFLDIWASWCLPCINEFPFLDTLKTELKTKNIVFIQLSCDQSERRWKMEMSFTNRKAGDDQWFLNGQKDFMKDLQVSNIPRYILIDKDGKIMEPFMTRASDHQTKVTLLELKGI